MGEIMNLSPEKIKEIESFLVERFRYLEDMRQDLDDDINEEVGLYNNLDQYVDDKEDWEEKRKRPFIYHVVNTMTSRIISALFAHSNYVKMFVEDDKFRDVEKVLTKWVQEELDKLHLKEMARDFVEAALKKRTSWLQLQPFEVEKEFPGSEGEGKSKYGRELRLGFEILDWYDVWFNLRARTVMDTDFFVRKRVKRYNLLLNKGRYFNLDKIESTRYDTENDQRHKLENSEYDLADDKNPPSLDRHKNQAFVTDEVEVLEYLGVYDFGEGDNMSPEYEPDLREVVFSWANRRHLIRVQEVELPTKRKRLMFPIRPLRQEGSMVGKSPAQVLKDMQYQLNAVESLQMQNFKNLIKLTLLYNRDADIDLEDLYVGDGNAIGYTGDYQNAVAPLPLPNVVGVASAMKADLLQSMHQSVGTNDPVTGAASIQEASSSASAQRDMVEQGMFKFNTMAENVYYDILAFINFIVILNVELAPERVSRRHPELITFLRELPRDIESSYIVDIALKDMSQRRDIERKQMADLSGSLLPLLQQMGGNVQLLMKRVLEVFDFPEVDRILQPEAPEAIASKLLSNPQLLQAVQSIVAQAIGQNGPSSAGSAPPSGASPQGAAQQDATALLNTQPEASQ